MGSGKDASFIVEVNAADARIIPATAFRELAGVSEELNAARSKMIEAQVSGRKQLGELRRQAREEGFAEGLRSAYARFRGHLDVLDRYCEQDEACVVELVLDVVHKLLGDLAPESITPALVSQALRRLRDEYASVVVFVHPDLRPCVAQALQRMDATSVRVTLETDDEMARTGCRIETRFGEIDAGLETQLRALRDGMRDAGAGDE